MEATRTQHSAQSESLLPGSQWSVTTETKTNNGLNRREVSFCYGKCLLEVSGPGLVWWFHDVMDPGSLMHCFPKVDALIHKVQDGEAHPHSQQQEGGRPHPLSSHPRSCIPHFYSHSNVNNVVICPPLAAQETGKLILILGGHATCWKIGNSVTMGEEGRTDIGHLHNDDRVILDYPPFDMAPHWFGTPVASWFPFWKWTSLPW